MQLNERHFTCLCSASASITRSPDQVELEFWNCQDQENLENLDSRSLFLHLKHVSGLACTCLALDPMFRGFCSAVTVHWQQHHQLSPFFKHYLPPFTCRSLELKSRHCVFTQSITCSLLTFDTNLTFLSISSVTSRRDRRGCVNSRLMTRLAGYYAQLSLMMIGIDAISHGFLRTSFRNGRGPPAPAASQGKNVRSRSVNNNFQPLLHSPHPFSKDWWYFDWYFLNIRSAAVWCAQMGWQWPKYHRQCFPP